MQYMLDIKDLHPLSFTAEDDTEALEIVKKHLGMLRTKPKHHLWRLVLLPNSQKVVLVEGKL